MIYARREIIVGSLEGVTPKLAPQPLAGGNAGDKMAFDALWPLTKRDGASFAGLVARCVSDDRLRGVRRRVEATEDVGELSRRGNGDVTGVFTPHQTGDCAKLHPCGGGDRADLREESFAAGRGCVQVFVRGAATGVADDQCGAHRPDFRVGLNPAQQL